VQPSPSVLVSGKSIPFRNTMWQRCTYLVSAQDRHVLVHLHEALAKAIFADGFIYSHTILPYFMDCIPMFMYLRFKENINITIFFTGYIQFYINIQILTLTSHIEIPTTSLLHQEVKVHLLQLFAAVWPTLMPIHLMFHLVFCLQLDKMVFYSCCISFNNSVYTEDRKFNSNKHTKF